MKHFTIFVALIVLFSTIITSANPQVDTKQIAAVSALHMPFIANVGQTDNQVAFYARTFGGTVFVTATGEIMYSLPKTEVQVSSEAHLPGEAVGLALKEELVNSRNAAPSGESQAIARVSYFTGSNPDLWRSDIPTYGRLDLGEIYPGIVLTLTAYGNNVEKRFYVQPGARPGNIALRIRGALGLAVGESGKLLIETELGRVAFTKPVAWQEIAGRKVDIKVSYAIDGDRYGFAVGDYDPDYMLTIDPILASTFIGGSMDENSSDDLKAGLIRVGNHVYMAGKTMSTDFPTSAGAYDISLNGNFDGFIVKMDEDLSTLVAATYIGGIGDDGISNIVVDGNYVYATGYTNSNNFPATAGAYDEVYNNGQDAFAAKLSTDLTTLEAATYLGGSGQEIGSDIGIDNATVFVAGQTTHNSFPTTAGVIQSIYQGGNLDGFITGFAMNLSSLTASTFLGDDDTDWINCLKFDASGNIYVAGSSNSSGFPTTTGAYQETKNEEHDAIITAVNPALTTIIASTFLGGNDDDGIYDLSISSGNDVYVAGGAWSSDFPTTTGAYDQSYNNAYDGFISRLDGNLTALEASTFLGG
ncbi:MAG: hypothetical protein GY869_13960, partial [Planctomycetes bacterium]|nr:hypothetical protein [Planctomycetota bacterium]